MRPKQKFPGGPPAYDGFSPARIIRGRVRSVDKVRHTCSVIGEMDNDIHEGIPVMPRYINEEGGGSFYTPESGSLVWLCFPSTDVAPFIMGGATAPKQLTEDDDEDPTDHRTNRPVLNEGDQLIASQGSARVILRKGGVVEIGATETCKRIYLPIRNIIREFCENYEMVHRGGSWTWECRRDDETHGAAKTPAEFRMQIREFCEDNPIIDLGFGRIAEEDDQLAVPDGVKGAIVARLNINERTKIWIDRLGNMATTHHGSVIHAYNGPRKDFHDKSYISRVKGLARKVYGQRVVEISRTDLLHVKRGREVIVEGGLVETVTGPVTSIRGPSSSTVKGGLKENIEGTRDQTITGNSNADIGGGQKTTVAEDLVETVVGRRSTKVVNKEKEDVAYEVTVVNGKLQVFDQLGQVVFAAGGLSADAAALRVLIKPTGSFVVTSSLGASTLEVNKTGFRVKTPGGEITLDPKGSVLLGPKGRGLVVTTLTHPVDRVTGTPILGSSSVLAGGVPSTAGLPSTFLAD